ncbi:MAG: hypothetical protein AAF591_09445 [Verrucomicrobiota bacterium]
MARPKHYVPSISKFLVCVLYHEGKRRGIRMTTLVAELLSEQLRSTPGWKAAEEQFRSKAPNNRDQHPS